MILLLSLILACQLILLRTAFCIKNLFSPIYVVIYFYLFTAILGYTVYCLFPDFASSDYISANIRLDPEENILTIRYFLSSINKILLGALGFLSITRTNDFLLSDAPSKTSFNLHFEFLKNIPKEPKILSKTLSMNLPPGIITLLTIIPTILLILGVGPENILFKDHYLDGDNIFLLSLGNISILPACLMLGYNFANAGSLFKRFICVFLIFINTIVLFSMATRFLSLVPIMFTAGYWFNSKRKKLAGIFIATLSGVLFSPLFYLSLVLRGQSQHGFLPYIQYVSELSPDLIFTSPLGLIGNLLFSFPLTGEVMKQRLIRDYPIDYLLISLNPLPGLFVGWYSINEQLNVNHVTPFNTIGEMYLYGDVICFLLFFALGIILMFITMVFQKNLDTGRFFYALVILVLIFLFSFSSLQYNLRSTTRILYLAFVLSCFFYKRPRLLKN